jgi:hypothetical protein
VDGMWTAVLTVPPRPAYARLRRDHVTFHGPITSHAPAVHIVQSGCPPFSMCPHRQHPSTASTVGHPYLPHPHMHSGRFITAHCPDTSLVVHHRHRVCVHESALAVVHLHVSAYGHAPCRPAPLFHGAVRANLAHVTRGMRGGMAIRCITLILARAGHARHPLARAHASCMCALLCRMCCAHTLHPRATH